MQKLFAILMAMVTVISSTVTVYASGVCVDEYDCEISFENYYDTLLEEVCELSAESENETSVKESYEVQKKEQDSTDINKIDGNHPVWQIMEKQEGQCASWAFCLNAMLEYVGFDVKVVRGLRSSG